MPPTRDGTRWKPEAGAVEPTGGANASARIIARIARAGDSDVACCGTK